MLSWRPHIHCGPLRRSLFHFTAVSTIFNQLYNIWPTVYTVLICNQYLSIFPASLRYCCYTTLGMRVNYKANKFSNHCYALTLRKTLKKVLTFYIMLSEPEFYSICSICSISSTQAWGLWRHSSTASSTMSVNQALPQVEHVSNWRLIHTILHRVPYWTVNWTKIRAVRK